MPKLLLKFNAAVIKEIPFDKPALSVGRKADNDVVIDNPAVSGRHCRLSWQGGTCFVEDLDSTNGTYVNEKRIKRSGLHHNDVVGVAKHSLVLIEDRPPEPPPATAAKSGAARVGRLFIVKGAVGQLEYELSGLSVYIGKSDRVQIPIRASGLFGSAPEVAAAIHRKADGYVLVAVAAGYPKVNGAAVAGSVALKEGDLIQCGATTMRFSLGDAAAT